MDLKKWLYNKMHRRNEAGSVVSAIPWIAIFYKAQNNMHTPAALQKLVIGCLGFKLSKLKFRTHHLLMDFKKG